MSKERKNKAEKARFGRRPEIRVVSFQEALDAGMSSALVRTIARSLDRIARDCFRRSREENFESRFDDSVKETKASLTEAGKINESNAYALRALAAKLKKAGK